MFYTKKVLVKLVATILNKNLKKRCYSKLLKCKVDKSKHSK